MLQLCFDVGREVMLDGERFYEELKASGHAEWCRQLQSHARSALPQHGDLPKWLGALESMPPIIATRTDFRSDAVMMTGDCSVSQREDIRRALKDLGPWRKGPFRLFEVELDAEWRSDQKWSRLEAHLDLRDKDVLDVGCGNGYYGWRMLGAKAKRVVGLEPYPLYNLQHAAIKRFVPDAPNYVVPGSDQLLADRLALFDVVFSMGVFYHCRNPIGHLESLRRSLKPGGQLVLETLVVDGDEFTVLLPSGRYAKMRNVWCIPSTDWLSRLLDRTGFSRPKVIDVTTTTTSEQRSTEWMTYESLANFLHPTDKKVTIEGYPRPKRAIVVALARH